MAPVAEKSVAGQQIVEGDERRELFHYTSAKALRGILDTNTLWATRSDHLNDSSEMKMIWEPIENIIRRACQTALVERDGQAQDVSRQINDGSGVVGVAERIATELVSIMREILFGENDGISMGGPPFVVSFSTHEGESEPDKFYRQNGMLSQWRGYGRDQPVAIVFDSQRLHRLLDQECERFSFWPRCYIRKAIYGESRLASNPNFLALAEGMGVYIKESLDGEPPDKVIGSIGRWAPNLAAVAGLFKHLAFHEEKERRIVLSPIPNTVFSGHEDALVKREEKKIHHKPSQCGSVPYVRLFEDCGENIPIDRIIVGPSRNQEALLSEVRDMVREREICVQRSEIPYVGTS